MTRSDLINPHLRNADAEAIVATIFDHITSALAAGQRVELRGFGAFSIKRRNPRIGRNPRTGEDVPVAARGVPYFRVSRKLLGRLNRRDLRKGKRF